MYDLVKTDTIDFEIVGGGGEVDGLKHVIPGLKPANRIPLATSSGQRSLSRCAEPFPKATLPCSSNQRIDRIGDLICRE